MHIDYKVCQDLISQVNTQIENVEFVLSSLNTEDNPYILPYMATPDYHKAWNPERMAQYLNTLEEMSLIRPGYYNVILSGGEPLTEFSMLYRYLEILKDRCNKIIFPTNGRVLEQLKRADIMRLKELSDNKVLFQIELTEPYSVKIPLTKYGEMLKLPKEREYYKLYKYVADFPKNFELYIHIDYNHANNWFNLYMELNKFKINYYLSDPHYACYNIGSAVNAVYQLGKIELTRRTNNQTPTKYDNRIPGAYDKTRLVVIYDGTVYIDGHLLEPTYQVADLVTKTIEPRKLHYYYMSFTTKNTLACIRCPVRDSCKEPKLAFLDDYWDRTGVMTVPIISNCKYQLLKYYVLSRYGFNSNAPLINMKKLEDMVRKYYGKEIPEVIHARYLKDGLVSESD